jgi:hypothetical protein
LSLSILSLFSSGVFPSAGFQSSYLSSALQEPTDVALKPKKTEQPTTLQGIATTPAIVPALKKSTRHQWKTPRPRAVLGLATLGVLLGALTGLVFRKNLLDEQKIIDKIKGQVAQNLQAIRSHRLTSQPVTEVSSYINELESLLMTMPSVYPELTGAVLVSGAIMAVGFLGATVLDGLQEAWVRWEESCIRAELMFHIQGSFQQGIRSKLLADVTLKEQVKVKLASLLLQQGIVNPQQFIAPVEPPRFKNSQRVADFLYVPTKENLATTSVPVEPYAVVHQANKTTVGSGWLTPVATHHSTTTNSFSTDDLLGANTANAEPLLDEQPPKRLDCLVNGIALLAGSGVGLFGFFAAYSLKQSADKVLALKLMKHLYDAGDNSEKRSLAEHQIQKMKPFNPILAQLHQAYGHQPEQLAALESVLNPVLKKYINSNNYLGLLVDAVHEKDVAKLASLLALGVLLGVGSALINGLREIEVTRLNAKTELSYQQYRLEELEPLYRRLNDEAELNQALAQLKQDLTTSDTLKEHPEQLARRCQAIISGVALTPAWISMSPAVQLSVARG